MAKFINPSRLTNDEQEKLLADFCCVISSLKTPIEAAEFLKDLMSPQEAGMLAKRLKIAEMLMEGKNYNQINNVLKVSSNTISRVNEWLKLSGEGYRLAIQRIKKESNSSSRKENPSWRELKKKYPTYFWPQLLLENIIQSAKLDDRRKLRAVLNKMDKKTALYKRIDFLLNNN